MEARRKRDLYRQRLVAVRTRTAACARAKAFADRLGFKAEMDLTTKKGVEELVVLPVEMEHLPVLASHVRQVRFLNEEIKRLDKEIEKVAETNEETRRLMTIPGVSYFSALLIASEVFDIGRFASSKRLVGYSGVAAGSFRTAGRMLRGHLCPNVNPPYGGRWVLIEIVSHYVRSNGAAKAKYDRVKRRHGWKTARVAIARDIAKVVYHVLKEGRAYQAKWVAEKAA